MKTYYINLDRAPERAAFMEQQFARAGLVHPIRFSAIDAAQGLPETGYTPKTWGPYWTMRPTEIAVFEGHRALWRQIVQDGTFGAIFEDDVLLSAGAGTVMTRLAAHGGSFDMVKLDGVGRRVQLGKEQRFGEDTVRALHEMIPSAAAYLVSPKGAANLLDRSEAYCDHLDDYITRGSPGYRPYQLMTAIAVQGMFAHVSDRPDVPSFIAGSERTAGKNAHEPYDRGPIPYRAAKELRRATRKVSRRLYADRALERRGGWIGVVPLADDLPAYK